MKEKVLLVDRICKLIKDNDLTNQKVESELGWGSGAIKKFDNNRPSIDKIIDLAEYLGVSVNDIIFDNINERTLSDEETKLINIYRQLSQSNKSKIMERSEILLDSENSNEKYIELFNLPVSAGSGIYLATEDKDPIKVKRNVLTDKASYALKVSGDSMFPTFDNGDIVLVQSTTDISLGELGIFVLNGEGYIKELGDNELISHNKKYDPIPLNDTVSCRGKVIGKLNKKDILEQD